MGAKASFLLAITVLWWSFGINATSPRPDAETAQSVLPTLQATAPLDD